jgi:hypothetical protein
MKGKTKLLIIKNIRFSHVNPNGTNVPAKTLNRATFFFPYKRSTLTSSTSIIGFHPEGMSKLPAQQKSSTPHLAHLTYEH